MSDAPALIDHPVVVITSVRTYDTDLTNYLEHLGLPSAQVLAAFDDRRKIINNIPDAIQRLSDEKRGNAYYISKMAAACGAGLFDAGLAYLWDAVVASLRERVARFDLEYFFDSAVAPADRANFKTADDLVNVQDSKLISACLTCGLITDVGYKLLDHIRDMRNWVSAAHPNNAEIGGLQLVGWLETCVNEVFSVDVTGPAVVAHQLLRNLREQTLTAPDVPPIAASLAGLPTDTTTALLRSAVGMYSDLRQDRRVVDNIRLLAVALWKSAPEEARYEVGVKYATLSVNAEIDRKERVREFLDLVGGLTYLPADHRAIELQDKLTQLEDAHFAMNNFYNEPPLARDLRKLVPSNGDIPLAANDAYVRTLMFCKVGRTSGVANGADPIYNELLNLFTDVQIRSFLTLPFERRMQSKLASESLARRFGGLAKWLSGRTTNRTLIAALGYLAGLSAPQIANTANDTQYKKHLANLL